MLILAKNFLKLKRPHVHSDEYESRQPIGVEWENEEKKLPE